MSLYVLHKRALRFVVDIGFRDSVKPYYIQLDTSPVPLLMKYSAIVEIRLMLNGVHPNVLDLNTASANKRGAENRLMIMKAANHRWKNLPWAIWE